MTRRLLDHTAGILLVAALFAVLVSVIRDEETSRQAEPTGLIAPYLHLDFIDFGNPLHRALFKEMLDLYFPDSPERNDSVLSAIDTYRQKQFTDQTLKAGAEQRGLTGTKLPRLGVMYLQFILVYVVVLVLTYYAAQRVGIYRFVAMKQGRSSFVAEFYRLVKRRGAPRPLLHGAILLLKALLAGIALAILFAPAYVIAYSLKTRVETDSYIFMILLGVLSNGLLITYANRFYTLLVNESRRGYVETAMVKNLTNSYAWGKAGGIAFGSILGPRTEFPGHVFQHILLNARYQFLPTLKEHASFLISGLIIIEMALNIQGHLCYELLQNILYKDYEVVIGILLAVFLVVKATEIVVDVATFMKARTIENSAEVAIE